MTSPWRNLPGQAPFVLDRVHAREQGRASHRGMFRARQGRDRLGRLRSAHVAWLASSSNALAGGQLVPHARNPAGEKNPRRRSPSRKSARCWLHCCIGNSTAIIPTLSADKQPAGCNATKPRDCTTGKNATAWHLNAYINADNWIQSN